jgi:pectinesterase
MNQPNIKILFTFLCATAASCANSYKPTTLPPSSTLPSPTHYDVPTHITISPDGSGIYKTIQDAIDAIPAYSYEPYTIHIMPGTYKGLITVPRVKPHIRFIGDDPATTILTFNLGARMPDINGKPIGTYATPSVRILADDFIAQNITFENSLGPHGQALAIEVAGDRDVFEKCRFKGWQDTVFADSNGRNYFHDCYIEGHVDFLFGKSTAVFESCEIHSKGAGYIAAASTEQQVPYGYVFLNCKLTADPDVKKDSVHLGRPWRPYAATAFINCEMGEHIHPQGWDNWKKTEREKTARYAEFGSFGAGGNMSNRQPWAKQLTPAEAKSLTSRNILAGNDGWIPFGSPDVSP